MLVKQRGHLYVLKNRHHKGNTNEDAGTQTIQYVNTEPGHECSGVTQQEVLRMLIDRNRYCTACMPDLVSEQIQYHLRMALVLHEARALVRKTEKGEIAPEYVSVGRDGHYCLDNTLDHMQDEDLNTFDLVPYKQPWEKECNHHCGDPKIKSRAVAKSSEYEDSEDEEEGEGEGEGEGEDSEDENEYKKEVAINNIESILNNVKSSFLDRVKFYYELHRKRHMNSVPWEDLIDTTYNLNLKLTAYNEAIREIDYQKIYFTDFDINKTTVIRTKLLFIHTKTGVTYETSEGVRVDFTRYNRFRIKPQNDNEYIKEIKFIWTEKGCQYDTMISMSELRDGIVEIWSKNGAKPSSS